MPFLTTTQAGFDSAPRRRYNAIEAAEEVEEETGWKLVHGDVFRPPQNPMMLSVLVGTGVQVRPRAPLPRATAKYNPRRGCFLEEGQQHWKFTPPGAHKLAQSSPSPPLLQSTPISTPSSKQPLASQSHPDALWTSPPTPTPTRTQTTSMAVITMVFAVLGFLSPANRGGLMTAMLLLFVFMGVPAGYASAFLHKSLKVFWRATGIRRSHAYAHGQPALCIAHILESQRRVVGSHRPPAVSFGPLLPRRAPTGAKTSF